MESSAHIKHEHMSSISPVDNFMSNPYPQYSDNNENMHAAEMLTPRSFDDESQFGRSVSGTPAPDVKPVKKRKSWGQQLPEPKTNLPPRKRAKTEDEKEQRRVERVLRNRRAAQSSRERKRQEVEALEAEKQAIERRNMDLEMRLADTEAKYRLLQQEFERIGGSSASVFRPYTLATPPATELGQSSPIIFSQGVRRQDPAPATVDPASLSPEIRAVANSSNVYSSDMMQHPAAVLCDLQCQSEGQQLWTNSTIVSSMVITQVLAVTYLIATSEVFLRVLSPLNQIVNSLRKRSSLLPTPSILNMIIWMVTIGCLTNSSSVTTSMMSRLRPKFSVRISLLKGLLACSPNLARPLMDATMAALRSVSKQLQTRSNFPTAEVTSHSSGLPSFEALMTVLWVILSYEKDRDRGIFQGDVDSQIGTVVGEMDGLFGRGDYASIFFASRARDYLVSTSDENLQQPMHNEVDSGYKR